MKVAAGSIILVTAGSLEGDILLFYTVFVYLFSDSFIHTHNMVYTFPLSHLLLSPTEGLLPKNLKVAVLYIHHI